MIRPLYDYYASSSFDLEEVIEDYVDNFYLKKYSEEKATQVLRKTNEITKLKDLNGLSVRNRDLKGHFPKYVDFSNAIKSSLWFSFQSSQTKTLGTLSAANEWDKTINRRFYIVDKEIFRNNILLIFKEYQIMGNVNKDQSDIINNSSNPKGTSILHEKYEIEKKLKAKQFEEGIRWFVWKTIKDLVVKLDLKCTDPLAKKLLISTIDTATASSDIKRIASNLGIDWSSIVDKQIDMVLLMKNSSHISLYNSDYGDSVDTIKFLENYEGIILSK